MAFKKRDIDQEIVKKKFIERSLISENTKIIVQKIETSDHIEVNGVLEGNIITSETVEVGPTGKILGNVVAESLVINGQLKGEVDVNTLTVGENGMVEGKEISYFSLINQGNGSIQGTLKKKLNPSSFDKSDPNFLLYEELESEEEEVNPKK